MQISKQGMWKGYHFSIEGTRKMYLFREKWYIKEEEVGPRGGASPYKHLLSNPPPPPLGKQKTQTHITAGSQTFFWIRRWILVILITRQREIWCKGLKVHCLEHFATSCSYYFAYLQKCSTWNLTNAPSKFAEFRRSLVISIQSPWSPADLWNSTLTRHSEIAEISICSRRRKIGNWIVTGFKKETLCEQIIRNMGPINTSCPSNSSFWISCTCWMGILRKTEFYNHLIHPGLTTSILFTDSIRLLGLISNINQMTVITKKA